MQSKGDRVSFRNCSRPIVFQLNKSLAINRNTRRYNAQHTRSMARRGDIDYARGGTLKEARNE